MASLVNYSQILLNSRNGVRKQFAVGRLDIILKDHITSTTAPEQHLDKMYITKLRQSVDFNFMDEERKSLCSMLRRFLGNIVVLFSPISADCLYKLLHATKEEYHTCFRPARTCFHAVGKYMKLVLVVARRTRRRENRKAGGARSASPQ